MYNIKGDGRQMTTLGQDNKDSNDEDNKQDRGQWTMMRRWVTIKN